MAHNEIVKKTGAVLPPLFCSLPEQVTIDLLRRNQVLQLFKTGERRRLEGFRRHGDAREPPVKLGGAIGSRTLAPEIWQMAPNLLKVDGVAAIVATAWSDLQFAIGEGFSNEFGDLAHAIVLCVVADVEDLIVDRIARRFERGEDGIADISDMDKRAPRRAVGVHLDQ